MIVLNRHANDLPLIDSFHIVSAHAPNCLVSARYRVKGQPLYSCLYTTQWNMGKMKRKRNLQIKIRLIVKIKR